MTNIISLLEKKTKSWCNTITPTADNLCYKYRQYSMTGENERQWRQPLPHSIIPENKRQCMELLSYSMTPENERHGIQLIHTQNISGSIRLKHSYLMYLIIMYVSRIISFDVSVKTGVMHYIIQYNLLFE